MHTNDDIYLGMETWREYCRLVVPAWSFQNSDYICCPGPAVSDCSTCVFFFLPNEQQSAGVWTSYWTVDAMVLSAYRPTVCRRVKRGKKKVKECSIAYDGRSWASRRSNGSCYLQRGITRNDFIFRILQPSVQACQTMFKKEFVLSMHRAKSLISDGMQEWIDNLL